VTFTAPGSGASGTFAGGAATASITTGANGIAIAPVFSANGLAGSYAVTATAAAGTNGASFNLTNAPVSAGRLLEWFRHKFFGRCESDRGRQHGLDPLGRWNRKSQGGRDAAVEYLHIGERRRSVYLQQRSAAIKLVGWDANR